MENCSVAPLHLTANVRFEKHEHIVDRIDEFSNRLSAHIKEDKDMERRLDKIEHKISYFTGMIIVVASLFSLLSTFLLKKIGLA